MVSKAPISKGPIPVTLLSGFLGSGKTTLLEHILTGNHGLKFAVVINDMSSLNIDGSLITDHKVTKKQEKLIQLQNGCICCTLRGDLLEELVSLAKSGEFQYIVIESTGISEPQQVAETFTTEFTEALIGDDSAQAAQGISEEELTILKDIVSIGGLNKLAAIDTCVTVVDAVNFISNFETTEFLGDREDGQDDLERTITDLMVDQIEFSDVIIINKISSVSKSAKSRISQIIKSLNPIAKVLQTDYCKVDLTEIINTGRYDFEKACSSAGWLQSIKEMTIRDGQYGTNNSKRVAPKPETEEYGINNFVYRARRPFHPKRLYEVIRDKFYVIEQSQYVDDEELEETRVAIDGDGTEKRSSEINEEKDDEEEEDEEEEEEEEGEDIPSGAEIVKNKKKSPFGPLLRSKGFFWLATRYLLRGEWSSAGAMLTLKGGIPWFSITGPEYWPDNPEAVELIKKDFVGKYGDRRQELVLIGLSIDKSKLTAVLDSCLLNDEEWDKYNKITSSTKGIIQIEKKLQEEFEDGFEDWLRFDDIETEEKFAGPDIQQKDSHVCAKDSHV